MARAGLIDALIRQESGGNNNAVSSKGATGLAQIMPKTGQNPGYGVTPLRNKSSQEQRRFATDYYDAMLNEFGGDEKLALAAYNAGPSAVKKYGDVPPFKETQGYVSKILNSLNPISTASADETPYQGKPDWNSIVNNIKVFPTEEQFNLPTNGKPNWTAIVDTIKVKPIEAQPMPLNEMAGKAISNIPKSGSEYIGSVANAVIHPVESAQSILNIANGALQHALPESANKLMYQMNPDLAKNKEIATNVADFYAQRYGSVENLKQSIAQDPVGVLGDLSSVLTLGGGAATRIPAIAGVAGKVSKLGNVIEPLNVIGRQIPKIGGGIADLVGGTLTHTGGLSLRTAAKAGLEGGQDAADFMGNLKENVPRQDVLDMAKDNLRQINATKNAEYRSGMVDISNDKTVLDMTGIEDNLNKAVESIQFKGQIKDKKAAELLGKITEEVQSWKSLDPVEYHTPEGLDSLKQKIGSLVEELPLEQKNSRRVGNNVYNAIKDSITKQAPTYAKVMKDYTEASDLIHEIERSLVGKKTTSSETALRKLQSVMRNNAYTNYGGRVDLARQLEEGGTNNLMPSLAGQALSAKTSRGFGGLQTGLTIGGGLIGGMASLPLTLGALALQSPRLMGEAAYRVGQASRVGKAVGKYAKPSLINYLYQTGQDRNTKTKQGK